MPKKHCHSFTLIELLVVIAVIAILAGITIGGVKFAFANSAEAAIKSRFQAMEMALEEYKHDWGYYPIQVAADTTLNFTMESPSSIAYLENDTTPYLQSASGKAMRYQYPGSKNTEKYDLWAPGVDEAFTSDGSGDDITNWTER